MVQLVHRPLQFTLALAALALLLIYALSRTSWRPSAPLRLARRRAWGQTLAAAARTYVAKPGLVLGIGILFIPIALLTALLQTLVLHGTGALGVKIGGGGSGLLGFFVLALGTALTLLGLGLVQAATARALVEVDHGRETGPLRAYLLAADSVRPLLGALVIAATVVSLLAGSIYLIPVAVWLAGRWALIAPSIELERLGALAGLRRSGRLVRGAWFKVASLIVIGEALSVAVGPIVGVALILGTNAPFWLVNVVAGVIYSVTMPLVAITTAYVYFDRRVTRRARRRGRADGVAGRDRVLGLEVVLGFTLSSCPSPRRSPSSTTAPPATSTGWRRRSPKARRRGRRGAATPRRELASELLISQNQYWGRHRSEVARGAGRTLDDLDWADGVAFGTPTRFGNVAAQLKQFIDQAGALWQAGNWPTRSPRASPLPKRRTAARRRRSSRCTTRSTTGGC